jgi:SSS family solute:Na+ symporter
VPPYTQRTFSSPDSRHARKGNWVAGVFSLLFFFVAGTLGLVARLRFPDIEPDQAIPTIVTNMLPVGLVGLAVAALLAVIMSTASSYLNSTAVVFVKDIYQPFIRPDITDAGKVWIGRIVTLVVGVASIVFALSVPSVVDAIL